MKQRLRLLQLFVIAGEQDESARNKRVLSLVLFSTLTFVVLNVPFVYLTYVRKLGVSVILLALTILVTFCLWFAHRGSVRLASSLIVFGLWSLAVIHLILAGGITSPGVLYLIVVCVFAGLLLRSRGVLLTLALTAIVTSGMVIAEIFGHTLPRYFLMRPFPAFVTFTLALLLTLIPFNFLLSELRQALAFAQKQLKEREEAGAALRENEDRYRDLVEHSHDLICTHDLHGRLLSINAHPARILGYSREEIVNTPMQEFLSVETRPAFNEYLARVQRDGVAEGLLVAITKTGERRIWEYRNTLRTDGVAAPIVRGMAHDITERWQAEKALRLSEEKFSKAFACSPGLLSISTVEEGRFLEVNDSFEKQCGYRRDELVGHTSVELGLWHEADRESLVAEVSKAGFVRNRETKFRAKEGQPITVLLSVEILNLRGQRCLLSVAQDITAQKKAEEALSQSLTEYRSLFLSAPCGICRVSLNGDLLIANDALVRMLGYNSAGELCARNIERDLYEEPSEQATRMRPAIHQFVRVEAKWKKKDGTAILVLVNSEAVRNELGETVCSEMTIEDITQQRAHEEQRQQSQKMEALGLFASGLAHDFNNTLTGILGYGQMLTKDSELSDKNRARAQNIVDACLGARELTRKLLGFSREDSVFTHSVFIDESISKIEGILRPLIGENIGVRIFLNCGPAAVLIEENTIIQIILNLASNARDAMPDGGSFTIHTSLADIDADIDIGIPDGRYVLIRVADSGCGMDRNTLDRIFEAFYTTKMPGKGTGLGLYTVYATVRHCSGHVRVKSEPGKGTEFSIYLPAAKQTVQAEPPSLDVVCTRPNKELIMVVEDNSKVRETLRDLLQDCGYRVICEASATEAIHDIYDRGEEVRLVLTDVVMPDMNGIDLVRRLKHTQPNLKALFITGWAPKEILAAEVSRESLPVLRKPFTKEELTSSIGRILERER
jgi:two-component system, cell cycle sensor histidine kinase and response regulator CckA